MSEKLKTRHMMAATASDFPLTLRAGVTASFTVSPSSLTSNHIDTPCDVMSGPSVNDALVTVAKDENTLRDDRRANTLVGSERNDRIYPGVRNDSLYGPPWVDLLCISSGCDRQVRENRSESPHVRNGSLKGPAARGQPGRQQPTEQRRCRMDRPADQRRRDRL